VCVPVPPPTLEGLDVPLLHRQGSGLALPLPLTPPLPLTLPLPHLDTVRVGEGVPEPVPSPPLQSPPPRLPVLLTEVVLDTEALLHPEAVMVSVGGREVVKVTEVEGEGV